MGRARTNADKPPAERIDRRVVFACTDPELAALDAWRAERGFASRAEALRFLMRGAPRFAPTGEAPAEAPT